MKLINADITEIEFITTSFDKSDGGTLQVRVRFNESVMSQVTPQLTVVNDNRGANHTLSYASGTGTNELVFSLTIAETPEPQVQVMFYLSVQMRWH